MNVSLAGIVQYQQSVGGAVVPLSVAAQATYTAYQQGVVDVPTGTASGTAITLPMGGVATGKRMSAWGWYSDLSPTKTPSR